MGVIQLDHADIDDRRHLVAHQVGGAFHRTAGLEVGRIEVVEAFPAVAHVVGVEGKFLTFIIKFMLDVHIGRRIF